MIAAMNEIEDKSGGLLKKDQILEILRKEVRTYKGKTDDSTKTTDIKAGFMDLYRKEVNQKLFNKKRNVGRPYSSPPYPRRDQKPEGPETKKEPATPIKQESTLQTLLGAININKPPSGQTNKTEDPEKEVKELRSLVDSLISMKKEQRDDIEKLRKDLHENQRRLLGEDTKHLGTFAQSYTSMKADIKSLHSKTSPYSGSILDLKEEQEELRSRCKPSSGENNQEVSQLQNQIQGIQLRIHQLQDQVKISKETEQMDLHENQINLQELKL